MKSHPIAIIGAGIAGLACALSLAEAGRPVVLFDKGRRPGGRIATRRADGTSFDHGAQFATARGLGLSGWMQRLQAEGAAAPWPQAQRGTDLAWVGLPGMSAIPGAMAGRLQALGGVIHTERHVGFLHDTRLRHFPAAEVKPGFVSETGGTLTEPFDSVILALPAPQAAPLLGAIHHPLAAPAASAVIAPCWAVMLGFDAPITAPDCQRPAEGPLAWIARNSSRPGHKALPDTWVLHATAAWSRIHLEKPGDAVASLLFDAFRTATGSNATPALMTAHRWRYALVEQPIGHPFLWDAPTRIGACGDWCLGPRVEAAFDSGAALAASLLAG